MTRTPTRAVMRQRLGIGLQRAALELQRPIGVGGSAPRQPRSPNASTRRWREVRAAKLKAQPECELKLAGCEGAAVEVDHVKQLRDGGDRFARDNLRSACEACHKRRHGKRKRYGFDVDGNPLDPEHHWNKSR